MKNRTLLFSLAAIIVAAGSAFTPVVDNKPVWVLVRVQGNPDLQCIDTPYTCDIDGAQACRVNVVRDITPAVIQTNGRQNDETHLCTKMRNSSDIPLGYDPDEVITFVQPFEPL